MADGLVVVEDELNMDRRRGFGALTVFERLRDEILSLELEPGQLIDEASLAKRFDVSRSPIREALVRLGSERLVKTLPNKGTIVAPLNLEEFPAYVDALDLIQRVVTRLAAQNRTEADLVKIKTLQDRFVESLSRNDALAMIHSNREFHAAIGDAGGNRIFADTYRRILDEGRRTLRLYFRSYDDTLPPELGQAHVKIIAAIENRQPDLAEKLAHEHAEQVHRRFVDYISQRSVPKFRLKY
ncbi:GntR family transcriptional regulator [Hoeflea sp. TYP-13]|uniref:GntR family transcriptional regulator n=1 Tax=Hoeflea sp. TYP-13 TaxID=3230023 RepID=UPI0034C6264E